MNTILAIDQSTSATKALLEGVELVPFDAASLRQIAKLAEERAQKSPPKPHP